MSVLTVLYDRKIDKQEISSLSRPYVESTFIEYSLEDESKVHGIKSSFINVTVNSDICVYYINK